MKNKIKKKDTEIKHLKIEIGELKAEYLRQLADKENLRKRLDREKTEYYQSALSDILTEFLSVLDNFERALQSDASDTEESFREGVEMIAKQLWDTLERQGVQELNPVGKPFDPELHEAVQRVEDGQYPPGTVAWVMLKGYAMGDRLVRPAMVGVAVEPNGDSNGGGGNP